MKDHHRMRAWVNPGHWIAKRECWENGGYVNEWFGCVYAESIQLDDESDPENERVNGELCTGLRDKNGVLIFEGDICKTKEGESCFQIVHRHEQDEYGFVYHSGFCAKWEDGTLDKDYKFYESINDCEIIGNIHQNPELL